MRNFTNKNKSVLSISVCISVALPIICMPLGVREGDKPAIVVRKAYADTFGDNNAENITFEEMSAPVVDDALTATVLNGGLIPATYYEGYEPVPVAENYSDVSTYTVYQQMDESGLPVELIDPMYFAPDSTTYYIAAPASILKEKPEMDSNTIKRLDYGVGVTRIGIGDTWSKIRTEDGEEGFVLTNTLSYEMVWTAVDRIVWVDTDSLSLRAEASVESEVIETLTDETRLRVVAVADKWFEVRTEDGTQGYVYGSYTTTQAPPTPTPTPLPTSTPTPAPASGNSSGGSSGGSGGSSGGSGSSSGSSTPDYSTYSEPLITGVNRESVVSAAESMLGKPYVWGACSSSAVDCSGLVVYCYGLLGISLPHYSVSLCSVGQEVSRENVAPGDIICWDNRGTGVCEHVGLYVGGGQCIEARGAQWGVVYCDVDRSPIITIRRVIE